MLVRCALTWFRQIRRNQKGISQGAHPIALVSTVTTSWETGLFWIKWRMWFRVVPRIFTAHHRSYYNDLQTTLWVTQRCFYSFQTFRRSTPSSVKIVFYGMGTVVDLCRGELLFRFHKGLFSLTKALIVETIEKNKNIFVSPIASFVNHWRIWCWKYQPVLPSFLCSTASILWLTS